MQVELRDSLVKEYLRILDSTRWVDSLHPQHKLLKAYNSNDTLSLKEAIVTLRAEINESVKYPSPTSCYTPPSIASYGFDEAYRFQYSAAFCDQSVNVTIGIKNDSIFIYSYHYTHNYMTDSCVSVDSLKNVLAIGQWEEVRYSMMRADIWGLKATNGIRGMDGSGLSVIGYQKPINAFEGRYNRVSRWAAEKSALGESFKLVLDLSGIKVRCFHY
jgi:hypothetical protein